MKLTKPKVKIFIIIVLAILGIIMMVMNSKTVAEAKHIWFFGKWNLPVWQLVVITLVMGFVVGVLLGSRVYESSSREEAPGPENPDRTGDRPPRQ